jgi:hypothetical protein
MGWEPVPFDVAEWMGMDDDYLRRRHESAPAAVPDADGWAWRAVHGLADALRRTRRELLRG